MPLSPEQAFLKAHELYTRLTFRRQGVGGVDMLLDYFHGKHPLVYATDQWRDEHSRRFAGFSDNWCGVVGAAPGERTAVDGFRIGDTTDVLSDDEKVLWRDWNLNEMPSQASQGFLMSTVAKRSSVLVWGDDNDEPVMTWEHPGQVIIDYDPSSPRHRRFALKSWLEDDAEYATLYTPDEVWKLERPRVAVLTANGLTANGLYVPGMAWGSGGWKERENTGDDVWPLPNPLGKVPIVEFANRPMLGGEPLSDIGGATAMQDAVNLLWAYLFTAADFAAMPARVVMGQEPPKVPILDANGQKIGEKPIDTAALTKGRMLWLTGQSTQIGQWDAAKLDVFTSVINVAVKHMAAQTRTPIHYIVGELGNVNGETLTATETPLAMKVRESHDFYTPRVREVFHLAALVRGNKGLAESCRDGLVQWRNPETRSEAQLADAAVKDKAVGFPLMWIAEKRYGLSQLELKRLDDMVEAERSDPTLEAVARGLTGGPPAAGGPDAPAVNG